MNNQSWMLGAMRLTLACELMSACTVESGEEGVIGNIDQAQYIGWNTHGFALITAGMALSQGEVFQWLRNGMGCRNAIVNDPCRDGMFDYAVPDNNYFAIRGIGRAKNTGHIYAWYNDATVTEGTAATFTAFSGGKRTFSPPFKQNSTTKFSMSELVEVDNSDNGLWYYYWKDSSINPPTFWRTTGTSVNASSDSLAQQVTVSNNRGAIVGIAFDSGSPAKVWTFYSDGSLNLSNTSLNLSLQ